MIYLVFILLGALAAEEPPELSPEQYVMYAILSLVLVCFGGLMSGLTVGLLSIDDLVLEMKI